MTKDAIIQQGSDDDMSKRLKLKSAHIEIKYMDGTFCPKQKREIKVKVDFIEHDDDMFIVETRPCAEFILETDIPEFSTLCLFGDKGDKELNVRPNDLCDFVTEELNKRKVTFEQDLDIEWNLSCEHHYKWYEEYDYSKYHCSSVSQEMSLEGGTGERKVLWCDEPEFETGCGPLYNVRAQ